MNPADKEIWDEFKPIIIICLILLTLVLYVTKKEGIW